MGLLSARRVGDARGPVEYPVEKRTALIAALELDGARGGCFGHRAARVAPPH